VRASSLIPRENGSRGWNREVPGKDAGPDTCRGSRQTVWCAAEKPQVFSGPDRPLSQRRTRSRQYLWCQILELSL